MGRVDIPAGDYEQERARLGPLLKLAEERHRILKDAFAAAVAASGIKTYNPVLLDSLNAAQKPYEEAGEQIVDYLQGGNPGIVPSALAFLSLRHRPFRSGYLCQRMWRGLRKFDLAGEDKERLRGILLDRLAWPWSQSRDMLRWIPSLATPAFAASLRALLDDERRYVRSRVERIISEFLPPSA